MANITTWSPDTCGCVVDIEGDWENPKSVKSIKKCPVHATLADGQAHLNVVWKGENQVKNYTFGIIQEEIPDITQEEYDWSFDAVRVLQVKIKRQIPGTQRNSIQTTCSNKFGQGKVKIS